MEHEGKGQVCFLVRVEEDDDEESLLVEGVRLGTGGRSVDMSASTSVGA